MEQFNIQTNSNKTFVLFHGTGGNEYSLLQFAGDLDAHANIRAYIGDYGIGAERRFFAPLTNGHLNRDDFNTHVERFIKAYEADKPTGEVIFMGYSNGANFILGLLEKHPTIADKVVLLHPSNLMYTFETGSEAQIIITAGARDGLSLPGDSLKLSKQLQAVFPNTLFKLFDHGHDLQDIEIDTIKTIL